MLTQHETNEFLGYLIVVHLTPKKQEKHLKYSTHIQNHQSLPIRFVSDAWDSFSESIMYALPSGLYTIFPWNVSTSEHDAGEASSESYSCMKYNDTQR